MISAFGQIDKIEISEKAGKTLAALVEELGGKVISIKKAKGAIMTKQVLDNLEESVNFVKLHQQGKVNHEYAAFLSALLRVRCEGFR